MEIRLINFSVKKQSKNSKMINENGTVFALYMPEEIKLEPCKSVIANMRIKVKLPHQMIGTISLLPSLTKQSLSIENQGIIRDSNSDIKIELLNRNFTQNVIIKKNSELAFLVILNKGQEKLNVKYEIM